MGNISSDLSLYENGMDTTDETGSQDNVKSSQNPNMENSSENKSEGNKKGRDVGKLASDGVCSDQLTVNECVEKILTGVLLCEANSKTETSKNKDLPNQERICNPDFKLTRSAPFLSNLDATNTNSNKTQCDKVANSYSEQIQIISKTLKDKDPLEISGHSIESTSKNLSSNKSPSLAKESELVGIGQVVTENDGELTQCVYGEDFECPVELVDRQQPTTISFNDATLPELNNEQSLSEEIVSCLKQWNQRECITNNDFGFLNLNHFDNLFLSSTPVSKVVERKVKFLDECCSSIGPTNLKVAFVEGTVYRREIYASPDDQSKQDGQEEQTRIGTEEYVITKRFQYGTSPDPPTKPSLIPIECGRLSSESALIRSTTSRSFSPPFQLTSSADSPRESTDVGLIKVITESNSVRRGVRKRKGKKKLAIMHEKLLKAPASILKSSGSVNIRNPTAERPSVIRHSQSHTAPERWSKNRGKSRAQRKVKRSRKKMASDVLPLSVYPQTTIPNSSRRHSSVRFSPLPMENPEMNFSYSPLLMENPQTTFSNSPRGNDSEGYSHMLMGNPQTTISNSLRGNDSEGCSPILMGNPQTTISNSARCNNSERYHTALPMGTCPCDPYGLHSDEDSLKDVRIGVGRPNASGYNIRFKDTGNMNLKIQQEVPGNNRTFIYRSGKPELETNTRDPIIMIGGVNPPFDNQPMIKNWYKDGDRGIVKLERVEDMITGNQIVGSNFNTDEETNYPNINTSKKTNNKRAKKQMAPGRLKDVKGKPTVRRKVVSNREDNISDVKPKYINAIEMKPENNFEVRGQPGIFPQEKMNSVCNTSVCQQGKGEMNPRSVGVENGDVVVESMTTPVAPDMKIIINVPNFGKPETRNAEIQTVNSNTSLCMKKEIVVDVGLKCFVPEYLENMSKRKPMEEITPKGMEMEEFKDIEEEKKDEKIEEKEEKRKKFLFACAEENEKVKDKNTASKVSKRKPEDSKGKSKVYSIKTKDTKASIYRTISSKYVPDKKETSSSSPDKSPTPVVVNPDNSVGSKGSSDKNADSKVSTDKSVGSKVRPNKNTEFKHSTNKRKTSIDNGGIRSILSPSRSPSMSPISRSPSMSPISTNPSRDELMKDTSSSSDRLTKDASSSSVRLTKDTSSTSLRKDGSSDELWKQKTPSSVRLRIDRNPSIDRKLDTNKNPSTNPSAANKRFDTDRSVTRRPRSPSISRRLSTFYYKPKKDKGVPLKVTFDDRRRPTSTTSLDRLKLEKVDSNTKVRPADVPNFDKYDTHILLTIKENLAKLKEELENDCPCLAGREQDRKNMEGEGMKTNRVIIIHTTKKEKGAKYDSFDDLLDSCDAIDTGQAESKTGLAPRVESVPNRQFFKPESCKNCNVRTIERSSSSPSISSNTQRDSDASERDSLEIKSIQTQTIKTKKVEPNIAKGKVGLNRSSAKPKDKNSHVSSDEKSKSSRTETGAPVAVTKLFLKSLNELEEGWNHPEYVTRNYDFRPSLAEDLIIKRNIPPKDIKTKDIKPKDIKPKDIKPKDINPKDIKPKDIKPKDIKPKDINSKDINPKDIADNKKQQDPKPKIEPDESSMAHPDNIGQADRRRSSVGFSLLEQHLNEIRAKESQNRNSLLDAETDRDSSKSKSSSGSKSKSSTESRSRSRSKSNSPTDSQLASSLKRSAVKEAPPKTKSIPKKRLSPTITEKIPPTIIEKVSPTISEKLVFSDSYQDDFRTDHGHNNIRRLTSRERRIPSNKSYIGFGEIKGRIKAPTAFFEMRGFDLDPPKKTGNKAGNSKYNTDIKRGQRTPNRYGKDDTKKPPSPKANISKSRDDNRMSRGSSPQNRKCEYDPHQSPGRSVQTSTNEVGNSKDDPQKPSHPTVRFCGIDNFNVCPLRRDNAHPTCPHNVCPLRRNSPHTQDEKDPHVCLEQSFKCIRHGKRAFSLV